jgi:hypothetical protein
VCRIRSFSDSGTPAAAFPFSDLEFPAENASTPLSILFPFLLAYWFSINLRAVRSAVGTVDKSKIRDKPFTTDRRILEVDAAAGF